MTALLNAIIDGDSDGTTEWLDFISDNKPNQEESLAHSETVKYRRQMFNQALYVLNKREKRHFVQTAFIRKNHYA